MPSRIRLAVLFSLLALSVALYARRARVRAWLYGPPPTATLVGRPAPTLDRAPMLAGPAPSLEALRGRVVLLHFWTFG